MPRFSLILPLYNGARYLRQAVQSVLTQEFADFEILLVDDCSTDTTWQLACELAEQDPRIHALQNPHNSGTLTTRTRGILQSTGDYIMLMDQDDELAPHCLATLDAILLNRPELDIVHTSVEVVAANERAAQSAAWLEEHLSYSEELLQGGVYLSRQFDGTLDWNIHHKAYRGSLARKAWSEAADVFLTLSDDLYMSYLLAAYAEQVLTLPNRLYIYNLGRGETLGSEQTINDIVHTNERNLVAYQLISEWIQSCGSHTARTNEELQYAYHLVQQRLVEHIAHEIRDKLATSQAKEAWEAIATHWPREIIAGELYRVADTLPDQKEPLSVYLNLLQDYDLIDLPKSYNGAKWNVLRKAKDLGIATHTLPHHALIIVPSWYTSELPADPNIIGLSTLPQGSIAHCLADACRTTTTAYLGMFMPDSYLTLAGTDGLSPQELSELGHTPAQHTADHLTQQVVDRFGLHEASLRNRCAEAEVLISPYTNWPQTINREYIAQLCESVPQLAPHLRILFEKQTLLASPSCLMRTDLMKGFSKLLAPLFDDYITTYTELATEQLILRVLLTAYVEHLKLKLPELRILHLEVLHLAKTEVRQSRPHWRREPKRTILTYVSKHAHAAAEAATLLKALDSTSTKTQAILVLLHPELEDTALLTSHTFSHLDVQFVNIAAAWNRFGYEDLWSTLAPASAACLLAPWLLPGRQALYLDPAVLPTSSFDTLWDSLGNEALTVPHLWLSEAEHDRSNPSAAVVALNLEVMRGLGSLEDWLNHAADTPLHAHTLLPHHGTLGAGLVKLMIRREELLQRIQATPPEEALALIAPSQPSVLLWPASPLSNTPLYQRELYVSWTQQTVFGVRYPWNTLLNLDAQAYRHKKPADTARDAASAGIGKKPWAKLFGTSTHTG